MNIQRFIFNPDDAFEAIIDQHIDKDDKVNALYDDCGDELIILHDDATTMLIENELYERSGA